MAVPAVIGGGKAVKWSFLFGGKSFFPNSILANVKRLHAVHNNVQVLYVCMYIPYIYEYCMLLHSAWFEYHNGEG